MKFAFVHELVEGERPKPRADRIPVSLMCDVLEISRAGFYAWRNRGESARAKEDAELTEIIKKTHKDHEGRLGVDRLVGELAKLDRQHSPKRVRRLAREAGLSCLHPRPYRATTVRDEANPVGLVDLVGRDFVPNGPNELWFTDITYIRVWGGWAYLAAIVDGFTRKVVGWSLADHMRRSLVTDASGMAIDRECPGIGDVVIHSDRGSQGGFNWSSQHLDFGGVCSDGDGGLEQEDQRCARRGAAAVACGSGAAAGDALARAAGSLTGGATSVLADHRHRSHDGRGLDHGGRVSSCGHSVVSPAGGMPPIMLTEPTGRYLSFEEREEIAVMRAKVKGVREIARALQRDPGTIFRELRRDAATRGGKQEYRATVAQWKAQQAAKRPKAAKLVTDGRLREYVQERLDGSVKRADGTVVAGPVTSDWKGREMKPHRGDRRWVSAWSPEQISNRLRLDFPDDESMRISPEAIYQSLFIEGRGALERELVACLRTGRALRQPRARTQNKPRGHITEDVVLSERPAEAADRAVPGHWEGDLIIGTGRSAIGTVIERRSRSTLLVHLPRLDGWGPSRSTTGPEKSSTGRLRPRYSPSSYSCSNSPVLQRPIEPAQYTSQDFRSLALANGIIPSVGHTGICFDNAVAESFNATIKKELIHLHVWPTVDKVKREVFRYIEVYYNRKRPHTKIGNLTPYDVEHLMRREVDKKVPEAA